jgi:peptide/nickel transport system substrate-binding protein/oligopeptide transport system substrate-binding protein
MPVIPMRFERNNFGHSARVKSVQMDLFRRVVLSRLEAN